MFDYWLDRPWLLPALLTLLLACFAIGSSINLGLYLDFANYYDAGSKIRYGEVANLYDPYALVNGRPAQSTMDFVAVPISAYLYVPLALLAPPTALLVFKWQNTAAYLTGLLILFLHCRQFAGLGPSDQRRFATLFTLLALIFQPFWFTYRVGGQVTPTVFLCFIASLLCHLSRRYLASALLMTFIILIKPGFAIGIALLALLSGLRFLLYFSASGLAAAALSISTVGWPAHAAFLTRAKNHSSAPELFWGNDAFTVILENLRYCALKVQMTVAVIALDWTRIAISLFLAASFFWLIRLSRQAIPTGSARLHFLFLASLCFGQLLLPVVWEHYLAVLFLPLAYFVACHRYFDREALALVAAIFLLPAVRNFTFVLWMHGAPVHQDAFPLWALMLLALSKSATLLLLAVFLQRHFRSWFRTYAAPNWIN
ncbi:MAG TPA: glycosyltransferase 87 family protein [Paludibaculum sp.]